MIRLSPADLLTHHCTARLTHRPRGLFSDRESRQAAAGRRAWQRDTSTHLRVKVLPEAELTMRARASWTRHGGKNIRPKHYCSRGCATDSRCRTRPNEPHNCAIKADRRKLMINKERRSRSSQRMMMDHAWNGSLDRFHRIILQFLLTLEKVS